MEGLQVLLSMKPDDEGVICIALQRKDKSANFSTLKNQRPATNLQPLDCKKLVINLSQRPLSTQEEDVLSLGLSFAIIPRQIPYQEIISATEVTTHRLDHGTADALRLAVCRALQQAKPTPQSDLPATTSNSSPQERREYCTCSRRQRRSYSDYEQRRVYTEDEADSG